ncbi:DUF1097 domain-containing protein [Galbibacter sp. EGI 63066]|uniref:DUF1097 domain-containing protein n=1 Tax=Galbibacter sp. EGI 63066 TaxID=2993559 RepID=UPI002249A1CB|nr:DUF1097 domain-containing protein [Galbibacter sp. EGI 63066]MCX2680364.1 DUF1097 domain-containing protein [Galbibacter sp. EGI 63066]
MGNTKQIKSFLQSLTLGALASSATLFTFTTSLPTWVLFLGWTSYFLLGKNVKSSLLVFIQQLLGILLAILIIAFGNFLVEKLGAIWFHLSVAIILTAVFYVTKLKTLNVLPAYFLGMIIWFGLNTTPTWEETTKAGIALFAGFVFGWINDNLNKKLTR